MGSGSLFARGSLKKRWRAGLTAAEAVAVVVEALADAADDDSATGGPDRTRAIYPVIATVTAEGYHRVADDELAAITASLSETDRGSAQGGASS